MKLSIKKVSFNDRLHPVRGHIVARRDAGNSVSYLVIEGFDEEVLMSALRSVWAFRKKAPSLSHAVDQEIIRAAEWAALISLEEVPEPRALEWAREIHPKFF